MKHHTLWARLLVPFLVLSLLAGCAGQSASSSGEADSLAQELATGDGLTIGVAVYALDNDEVRAIRDYLENYIGDAFGVSFLYSNDIESAADEIAFVEELAAEGVQGCISFLSSYIEEVLPVYEQYGIYYVGGSGTLSDSTYQAVKDYSCFLGMIGSAIQDEWQAGYDIAAYFTAEDTAQTQNYLIFVGGAGMGNEMHLQRAAGMLTALAEAYNLTGLENPEELVTVTENTTLSTQPLTITLVPGYTGQAEQVEALASTGDYDVILSVQALGTTIETIAQVEITAGADIQVGLLDCFTEANYTYFNTTDAYGNPMVNYLVGKYGAVAAPAFVAILNACSGYAEDFREDGQPFRLYQTYWYADSTERFNELYASSVSTFDNTYSAVDMLTVLKEYNPEADFTLFRTFAEK